ncbi:MAG: hypothetical protein KDA96_25465 [Planctomycetaceae bacterium]|nr:hypothetical protein [Planctomycetaceae bacterium]
MHQHTASVTLSCSLSGLRQFLGRPVNLPRISDPELALEILNAPEEVTEGEVIEFRITAYGFKQRATNRYTVISDNEISEEQTDGPLRAWKHRQSMTQNADGTVTLTDTFEFEPPGGMMGFVMTAGKITESLEEGLQFRYETLQQLVADGEIS